MASFIGIAVTSAGITLYGEVLWDPLKLVDKWDNRAATFFTSFAFALSTLGTNISANSLSAGNDMTVLCPRYLNIRRGQVICAFLGGWALCPWEILAKCVRPGSLDTVTGLTTSAIAQRNGLSIFHERLHCLPWPNYRNHDHRRRLTVFCSVVSVIPYSDNDSTGSYTARMSMCPQCIGRTAGIGIHVAWYGAFRRESDISTSLPQYFAELARSRRSAGFCATKPSWARKQHQNEGARWHRRRASI